MSSIIWHMIGFGQKIKELRKETGITQRQLAEQLGVSRALIAMYETDKNAPSAEILVAIAEFFEITYDELFEYVKSVPQ